MAYKRGFDERECWSSSNVDMDVYGATGGSMESCFMAANRDREDSRSTPVYSTTIENLGSSGSILTVPQSEAFGSVDGRGTPQGWQSAAAMCSSRNPDWSNAGTPNSMANMRPDNHDQNFSTQSAIGFNFQCLGLACSPSSAPWDPLAPSQHRPAPLHVCNPAPTINVHSPAGESRMATMGYQGEWPHSISHPTRYGQSFSYQQSQSPRPGGSVRSAPTHMYERESNSAAAPEEASGRSYHNSPPNVLSPKRYQQNDPISPSATGMSSEECLYCSESGCSATFNGSYAKGNLARHRRLKHGSYQHPEGREYNCEQPGCSKSFKRQDARLKHYRKVHRHLAPGPALSRTKYRSM